MKLHWTNTRAVLLAITAICAIFPLAIQCPAFVLCCGVDLNFNVAAIMVTANILSYKLIAVVTAQYVCGISEYRVQSLYTHTHAHCQSSCPPLQTYVCIYGWPQRPKLHLLPMPMLLTHSFVSSSWLNPQLIAQHLKCWRCLRETGIQTLWLAWKSAK